MIFQPEQFTTYSLRRSVRGKDICRIMAEALNSVNAEDIIQKHVTSDVNHLIVDNTRYDFSNYQQIYVIGAGKACVPMAASLQKVLKNKITSGLIITKDGYVDFGNINPKGKVEILVASHPLPDQRNINAASKLISFISNINHNDLVILLLSGGGSALLMCPASGISLDDIGNTTSVLMRCGASISEINTIRKHMDLFKGGGLIKFLASATVISLIISDVVGDNLEVIASGPTVADPTTFVDAWTIFQKYEILEKIPTRVKNHILNGIKGEIDETMKPGDPLLSKVYNVIVGRNIDAVNNAEKLANLLGFHTKLLTTCLEGEAAQIGKSIVNEVNHMFSPSFLVSRPACLIAGGETTVTISGKGVGGRNQELALGAVKELSGSNQIILSSLATDGGDGPTDAAGAVATNETYSRGLEKGLDPNDFLLNNDSYHYFNKLGDLIKIGPTLTNVNDLVFIFFL
jgi:glycerate 2-kinase